MISVVIRIKNEAPWLQRCLTAVRAQDYPEFEIIVVDNASSDGSDHVARRHGCRVVSVADRDYRHGYALNLAIARARGRLVAILSGHCVPAHDRWLSALAAHFHRPSVAGAYGRQIPLPDSDVMDKRDLWTTFGLERRVQRTDCFFHNANSMIRRDVWARFPFDDNISGVEDRDWAKRVVAHGYELVYDPVAMVHHYHGIHQGRDVARAERVVRVIEMIHGTRRTHGNAAIKTRSRRSRREHASRAD